MLVLLAGEDLADVEDLDEQPDDGEHDGEDLDEWHATTEGDE